MLDRAAADLVFVELYFRDGGAADREMLKTLSRLRANDLAVFAARYGLALEPPRSCVPAQPILRSTAPTTSKIWSMWLRSQIRGGENSKVSPAIRTMRPAS
jgi:hypothetical protein